MCNGPTARGGQECPPYKAPEPRIPGTSACLPPQPPLRRRSFRCRISWPPRRRPGQGKAVVHCHGCFDIVHPGTSSTCSSPGRWATCCSSPSARDYAREQGRQPPADSRTTCGRRAWRRWSASTGSTSTRTRRPSQLLEALRPDVYVKGREYETKHRPAVPRRARHGHAARRARRLLQRRRRLFVHRADRQPGRTRCVQRREARAAFASATG